VAPADRVDADRVDVREQPEHRPIGVSAQARDEVGSLEVGADHRDLEPGPLEQPREVLLGRPLVAGRVHGVEANEVLKDRDRFLHERVGWGEHGRACLSTPARRA
jgi:hypothetical protein